MTAPASHTSSRSSSCNMKLIRMAFVVAYLHLSLAVCVRGRIFKETSPDGSLDTAVALGESHALIESSRISWRSTPSARERQEHQIPPAHFSILRPVSQKRRSLRNVHIIPAPSPKERTGRGGLNLAAVVIIMVSTVFLVFFVAVLVFWCRRKENSDPSKWKFLGLFKRRNPQTRLQPDQEELYAQAKGDTHLSGY